MYRSLTTQRQVLEARPCYLSTGTNLRTSPVPRILIAFVSRAEIIPAENKDYELKCPLVVIEEKRPGIVREQDWQNKPLHPHSSSKNWMGLLLPQLFL